MELPNEMIISLMQMVGTAVLTAYVTSKVNETNINNIKEKIKEINESLKEISQKVNDNENRIIRIETKLKLSDTPAP